MRRNIIQNGRESYDWMFVVVGRRLDCRGNGRMYGKRMNALWQNCNYFLFVYEAWSRGII